MATTTGKKQKKGKSQKGVTLQLNDFLANDAGGGSQVAKKVNWAEDVEDEEYIRRPQTITLPTAPRSSRILDDDALPKGPPYVAFISNLPYDAQDQDIYDFFELYQVVTVKLPREDGENGRLRGFGYIEFETKDDLIDVIRLPDPTVRGRRIKIDLPTENDKNMGGQGNWRQRQSNYDDDGGRGGSRRGFSFQDRDNSTPREEGGSWRSGDRPKDSPPPQRRQNNFDRGDRGGDRGDRGGDRGDRGGDRGDRGGDRGEFRRRGYENRYRDNDHDEEEAPQERPKLVLQPRTLPIENLPPIPPLESEESEIVKKPEPVPAAKIFGEAKPVDTAAKEREIEERLEREREAAIAAARAAKQKEKENVIPQSEDETEANKLDDEGSTSETKPAEIKKEEITSWRVKKDDDDQDDRKSTQSPPPQSRRYSPVRDYKENRYDKRGGGGPHNMRRNNDRDRDSNRPPRDNRDFNRNDRDNNRSKEFRDRDYNKDNRDRNEHRGPNDRYPQKSGPRDRDGDRDNRDNHRNRSENIIRRDPKVISREKGEDSQDDDRMPKYQPPSGPNLSMSNKFAAFEQEDDTSE